jgi:hypothetical protein
LLSRVAPWHCTGLRDRLRGTPGAVTRTLPAGSRLGGLSCLLGPDFQCVPSLAAAKRSMRARIACRSIHRAC